MGIRSRLIAATLTAAISTLVVGAATATAAPPAPAGATASAPVGAKKDGDKKDGAKKDAPLVKVAASLHVTVKQLTTALDNLKQAIAKGTDKATAVAAFAKELRVSFADAEKALQALSNYDKGKPDKGKPDKGKQPGVPDEAVKLLAAELHISADRARQVFKDLEKVSGKGEDVVKDPAFIAIAKGLHITPQRLLEALRKVKQELAGKEKEKKVPNGSPAR